MSITWHGVTVHFAVGWTSSPSTDLTGTTWTDESAYLRSITVNRGRSDELGTFQPGRMTVVLDNRTRRFDPNYTAGALYGNLLPMRRARLRLNSVDVWGGFVDDIPQGYDISNRDATVTLTCTDGFAVLALSRLPESVYAVTVAADTPTAWYRLGETYGTIAADSSGNNHTAIYGGAPTTTGALTFGGTDSAMQFVEQTLSADTQYVSVPNGVLTGFPFTVEAWFQTTDTAAYIATFNGQYSGTGEDTFSFGVNSGAVATSILTAGATNTVTVTTTTATYNNDLPHHAVIVWASGNTAAIYVDGVLQATSVVTGGTLPVIFPPPVSFYLAADYSTGSGSFLPSNITLDEVAFYNGVSLNGTQVLAHYNAGHAPSNGSTATTQMTYILDQIGWPAADRDLDSGMHTMQSLDLAGQTALGLMQGLEKSEQGQLFMGPSGLVVARDRVWRYDQTVAIVSQATFGDDGTGSELPYSDIQTDGGANFLRNRVIVSRQGGGLIEATDPTSIGLFYERTDDELSELHNSTDDDILYLAQWRVETRANPIPRVTVLEVRPRHPTTGLIAAMLALDIGYRVTVKRRPQNVGTAITYTMLVEGISHELDADGIWIMRLYLSSFDSLSTIQPLVLDSATQGLLDTNVLAP